MKNYTGAGVLLVDSQKPEILLINDWSNAYNDMGGRLQGKTCPVTASTELYEETRRTVHIPPSRIAALPCVCVNNTYKMYICKMNTYGICAKYMKVPHDTLPDNYVYHETKGIARFCLDQFKHKHAPGPVTKAYTTTGRLVPIHGRVAEGIQEAIKYNYI